MKSLILSTLRGSHNPNSLRDTQCPHLTETRLKATDFYAKQVGARVGGVWGRKECPKH